MTQKKLVKASEVRIKSQKNRLKQREGLAKRALAKRAKGANKS